MGRVNEQKTMMRFFDTNGEMGYEETTEGFTTEDIFRLLTMMDLAKYKILKRIDDQYAAP